jgi:monofunctional biosynthetic peptidoglycan transglycosylase
MASKSGSWVRAVMIGVLVVVICLYALCAICVLGLRWIDPPTTMVQIERRLEAKRQHRPYKKRYDFVPLQRIAPVLQHAVISAEDGRFRQHHGFDWVEMQKVLEDDIKRGRMGRGGSTITQQLVKNLFLTTERSFIRKGAEFAVVPMVEALLSKDRILELYLNVIEWGPGVFGAEAAAEYHYHLNARELDREQSARLAACLPSPRRRRPPRMNQYSAAIMERMTQVGW